MHHFPLILIGFRLLLALLMPALAWLFPATASPWLVGMMYAGLLSDIFDGIIARRAGVATATLRRLDSQTDLVFWLSVAGCAWLLHPEVVRAHAGWLAALLVAEVLCYGLSFLRFRRETCTHSWLSKAWGISLLGAFTALIGFGYAGGAFGIAVVLGLISQADVLLILLLLPAWNHDIPSSYHAWLIRKGIPFRKNGWLN